MTKTVTVHEAKTHLSRLLAVVEAGGEFVIARGSKPIARMIPVAPRPLRRPGVLAHLGPIPDDVFAPMTEADLKEVFGTKDF